MSIREEPGQVGPSERVVVTQRNRSRVTMFVKRWAQAGFAVLIRPRLWAYRINRLLWGENRAFSAASESIARMPGIRGVYARQAFYRCTLAECGRDVYFGWQSAFSMPAARVGERAYIGRGCNIGLADIGAETMLADGVQVLSGGREHGMSSETGRSHQAQPQVYRRVTIGRGAWIGANSVVMADVGDGAVIGAGAVVNRAIPSGAIAAGVPARVVRRYVT